jgi:translation elongation factor EF-G
MHVPEPVISLAIKPQGQETPNFARALNRFRKEDPTFKIHFDKDSKEVGICIIRLAVLLLTMADNYIRYGRTPS